MNLEPLSVQPELGPVPEPIANWIQLARTAAKGVNCFDFISSDPHVLYGYLKVINCRRYCEWGSGIAVGVGMASLLGFAASGIEINQELALRSQELLADESIDATIIQGSYHEIVVDADVVYVYCWPGQARDVRERFINAMPRGTILLLADGAEKITPLQLC